MDIKHVSMLSKEQSTRIIDPREVLAVGDRVEIYSKSANKWCKGKVQRIYHDEYGEWLTICYAKHKFIDSKKDIGRYSEYLRPMELSNAQSIVMYTKNDLDDDDEEDIDDEFIKLFISKTRLNVAKPEYFIQILSILEDVVTLRLDINIANNDEQDQTFIVKDVDKDIELQSVIVSNSCNHDHIICNLFIYNDLVAICG